LKDLPFLSLQEVLMLISESAVGSATEEVKQSTVLMIVVVVVCRPELLWFP
jgi:hypothetical protein